MKATTAQQKEKLNSQDKARPALPLTDQMRQDLTNIADAALKAGGLQMMGPVTRINEALAKISNQ